MDILIKALQLILSLSILVVLHELGHFLPAKLFKTRVEKFYLFFNPWFSLFKYKKGETEYGIGWLPLGGYVKISGMIDESMDKAQMEKPAESWEFRSKPAWQRLIIMAGGVTVNLLLGFFIYAMMLYAYGEIQIDNQKTPYGYAYSPVLQQIGLKNGDQILEIGGEKVPYFNTIIEKLILAKQLTVLREGQTLQIDIPVDFVDQLQKIEEKIPLIQLRFPLIIGEVLSDSPNQNSGLEKGDQIVKIDTHEILFFDQLNDLSNQWKDQKVPAQVKKQDGSLKEITLSFNPEGKLGIYPQAPSLENLQEAGIYFSVKKTYSLAEAFPAGIQKGLNTLINYIKQLALFFKPETKAYKSIGGFASIGSLFPSVWDGKTFWAITALLSIILAFMNILPIPALDGGHILFLLYEIISGKAPSQRFLEIAQTVGMVLLFSLLLYANGNDLFKIFSR